MSAQDGGELCFEAVDFYLCVDQKLVGKLTSEAIGIALSSSLSCVL